MPSSANLSLGPGRLYVAPIGTAEPTDLSTALPAAWAEIGYTTEGSEFTYSISTDPVNVAESLDPVFNKTTGRSGTLAFNMAENTVRNLTLAFNGGTVTSSGAGATAIMTYEPPAPGSEVRRMVVFVAEDGSERWIFRQVFQSGDVAIARRQSADVTSIPVSFALEMPTTGLKPFKAIYSASTTGLNRSGGAVVSP